MSVNFYTQFFNPKDANKYLPLYFQAKCNLTFGNRYKPGTETVMNFYLSGYEYFENSSHIVLNNG